MVQEAIDSLSNQNQRGVWSKLRLCTTDRQWAGRGATIKALTMKERTHIMTEMTLPQVEEPKEEVTATPPIPVQKMYILICYVTSDVKHLGNLDRHLQLMYRRLGSQVRRHYFGYDQIPEEPK